MQLLRRHRTGGVEGDGRAIGALPESHGRHLLSGGLQLLLKGKPAGVGQIVSRVRMAPGAGLALMPCRRLLTTLLLPRLAGRSSAAPHRT